MHLQWKQAVVVISATEAHNGTGCILRQVPGGGGEPLGVLLHICGQYAVGQVEVHSSHVVGEGGVQLLQLQGVGEVQLGYAVNRGQLFCTISEGDIQQQHHQQQQVQLLSQ
jgi:hypothetical protein